MGLFSRRKEPNAGTNESSDGAAIGHSDSGVVLIQRVRNVE